MAVFRLAAVSRVATGVWIGAGAFFVASTAVSYARWANFEYTTFDLAYYVQGLWQLLHGRLTVSILDAPLLGNHVEPIVVLFAPLFAFFPHPVLLVAIQNAALACLAPIGYDIARLLGFRERAAAALAASTLLAPAAGFVALHEFHPEAFTAPFLLLMYRASVARSVRGHWIWFCAVLACKENMALLLIAYCAVQAFAERRCGREFLVRWFFWPALLAAAWFLLCTRVITPALNSGSIDYLALYYRLGSSPADILRKAVTEPGHIFGALSTSLSHGDLLPGMLLPLLCLPLLRPRWLLISAPILLQHLLSWRSSEWQIYFHYSAPLIPLFWIAAIEALAALRSRNRGASLLPSLPYALVFCAAVAQFVNGPFHAMWETAATWSSRAPDRTRKAALISRIPPNASVVAPLNYLSHLAMRERCYSLHFLLKGLKTLSRARYEPPPPADFVLIDYSDSATFDAGAGYYHPKMRTAGGAIVPSSESLLHEFLARASWTADESDEYAMLSRDQSALPETDARLVGTDVSVLLGEGTELVGLRRAPDGQAHDETMRFMIDWNFAAGRDTFPWLELVFTERETAEQHIITKGLCAPQITEGSYQELWSANVGERLPAGTYHVEARLVDNSKRLWAAVNGATAASLLCAPIPLGDMIVSGGVLKPRHN